MIEASPCLAQGHTFWSVIQMTTIIHFARIHLAFLLMERAVKRPACQQANTRSSHEDNAILSGKSEAFHSSLYTATCTCTQTALATGSLHTPAKIKKNDANTHTHGYSAAHKIDLSLFQPASKRRVYIE